MLINNVYETYKNNSQHLVVIVVKCQVCCNHIDDVENNQENKLKSVKLAFQVETEKMKKDYKAASLV